MGLTLESAPWDHSTYSKSRDRLIEHQVIRELFERALDQARKAELPSAKHFSVDGTLIRAWVSQRSVVPKDGPPPPTSSSARNPEVNFKGTKRSSEIHQSYTDPGVRLATKFSKTATIPVYAGHAPTENRHDFVADIRLMRASGNAERKAALKMLAALPGKKQKTAGADKTYDTADFVERCRALKVTPHVAQNTSDRASRIDGRTARHPSYVLSQSARKFIETVFGNGKQLRILRRVQLPGLDRMDLLFTLTATGVNLRRLPRLLTSQPSR